MEMLGRKQIVASWLGWVLIWGAGATAAWAAQTYKFSGKVTGVRKDTIAVSRGLDTLEFRKDAKVRASRSLRGLKVGDEITLWYQLAPVKAEPYEPSGQQPGQAAPGEKKQIIIDDRAFYDAANGAAQGDPSRPGA